MGRKPQGHGPQECLEATAGVAKNSRKHKNFDKYKKYIFSTIFFTRITFPENFAQKRLLGIEIKRIFFLDDIKPTFTGFSVYARF